MMHLHLCYTSCENFPCAHLRKLGPEDGTPGTPLPQRVSVTCHFWDTVRITIRFTIALSITVTTIATIKLPLLFAALYDYHDGVSIHGMLGPPQPLPQHGIYSNSAAVV